VGLSRGAVRRHDGPRSRRDAGAIKRALLSHGAGISSSLPLARGSTSSTFPPAATSLNRHQQKMLGKPRHAPALYEASGGSSSSADRTSNRSGRDGTLDQAFTSCTFCSVTRPVEGLREIFRVLRPGGDLYMFEHWPRYFPFNLARRDDAAIAPVGRT
jgi:SAM-dependent methyltransferase